MTVNLRRPVAAGSFYPSDPEKLKKQIASFVPSGLVAAEAVGCILPHAGYIYSGRVAVETLARVKIPQKVILLGPNHTGLGAAFSLMAGFNWQTPLGVVEVDRELAGALLKRSALLEDDSEAQLEEHSLEVELPLLQYFAKEFKIVPIAVAGDNIKMLKQLGIEISGAIKELGLQDSVLLVASSDMTHYEPEEDARVKDNLALAAIAELDADKLMRTVKFKEISMCGYAPVAAMITAVRELGAARGNLVQYQTSAAATKDKESVVGYAGVIIN